jgi:hypothetical protein
MYVSMAVLVGWPSSMLGLRLPIRVFKSPHTMVVNCGCNLSSMSSICSVASVSEIFLLVSEDVGGRYILTTLIL